MTPIAPVPPAPTQPATAQLARSDQAGLPPDARPLLGTAAVTALDPGGTIRMDPDRKLVPLEPPADPPPVKGLGIPPLNTRQVGDFDIPEETGPAARGDLSTRLADLDPSPRGAIDLRR